MQLSIPVMILLGSNVNLMFRSSMVEPTTDNRETQVRFLSKQPVSR